MAYLSEDQKATIRKVFVETGNAAEAARQAGTKVTTTREFLYREKAEKGSLKIETGGTDAQIAATVAQTGQEQTSFQAEDNVAEAVTFATRFKTLDEWLAALEVDWMEWAVESAKPNSWQVAMKDEDGKPYVVTVYQFKATLTRLKPIAVELAVQPVTVTARPIKWAQLPKRQSTRLKLALIWPDMQVGFRRVWETGELIPFHDRQALDIGFQLTAAIRPDVHVNLGDNLDLPEWSDKYLCSPESYWTTQPSVIELAWIYAQQRALSPDARIHWILGNHDQRFLNAVIKNLKQAYRLRPADDPQGPPLVSLHRLIGAEALGVEISEEFPQGEVWLGPKTRASHGWTVRSGSGKTTAAVMASQVQHNEIFGHIHRAEINFGTHWPREGEQVLWAMSPGTLASIQPNVVPAHGTRHNWQQAFGTLHYFDDEAYTAPALFPVTRGVCIANGNKYTARSNDVILEQLESDTRYNFRRAAL